MFAFPIKFRHGYKETHVTEVIRTAGKDRELVRTSDPVNPYGLRVDGTVVLQSWSRALVEMLLDDERFCLAAERELDAA
jgi:hypothetical protein